MSTEAVVTQAQFRIPAAKLGEALTAMRALRWTARGQMAGGEYPRGGRRWFARLPEDYDERFETVSQLLEALSFETREIDGDVAIVGFHGPVGDERVFLGALAPVVPPGSFLNWADEDGQLWRFEVDAHGTLRRLVPRIQWVPEGTA